MSINVYLFFDGNCREAFELYRSAFGGDYAAEQTYADGPADMGVPESAASLVMHIALPLGDAMLMGSDRFPGTPEPFVTGNNVAITAPTTSRADCDRLFAALSDGGDVQAPMEDTFWGAYFGRCRDRFGVNWMFNFDPDGQSPS